MRAFSALALTLALALTACGGGDDSSTSHSSTEDAAPSTSESSSPTSPTKDSTADQAIADAAVLTIDDMPTGWQAEPTGERQSSGADQELADCVGVDLSELENDANGSADSDDFRSPEGVTISSSAVVAADEAWMTRAFEIKSSEQLRSCIGDMFEQEFSQTSQGIEWDELKIIPMDFPTYGDELAAFRMSLTAQTQNGGIVLSSDLLMARVGRAMVTVTVISISGPVNVTEQADYIETVVERMESGLGDS